MKDGEELPPKPLLRATPQEAVRAPVLPGHATGFVMRHGSMELRWFAPKTHDPQVPHDRDELYMVVSGSGVFLRAVDSLPLGDDVSLPLHGEERVPFGPGDVLFVPAGTVHRFESFTPDFATWIVFYGPEGGEPG